MESSEIIGYVASVMYVVSLFPEIYIVHKTKQCNLTTYFLLFQIFTTSLFISYDLLMDLMPLLLADCLLMLELFYLIGFKFFKKKKKVKNIRRIEISHV